MPATIDAAASGAAAVVALGALCGLALAVHVGLRRAARRLALALAARDAAAHEDALAATLRWRRRVDAALALPKLGLWIGVALAIVRTFPPLDAVAARLLAFVVASFSRPLFVLNERGYSALDLVALPALLAALWVGVGAATALFRAKVLRTAGADRAAQETVATFARYALVFLGSIVVLQAWGIDVGSITMVAGVLGVGIGFGLQHIANNFVSGLLIGAERPIRPGDFVSLGSLTGTVERIGARSTEVLTNDRVKILVPNSRFLEQEVVNWTHGDPVCRLHVPVGVAYGSSVERVRKALLDAARGHEQILADPPPRAEFRAFGESALEFELLVWTRDPRSQFVITSDLNYRIAQCLRREDVTVPFPQRDVHLSPRLEEALLALVRHRLDGEDPPRCGAAGEEGGGDDGPAEGVAGRVGCYDTDLGPRTWSAAEIRELVGRMRGPDGVPIHDRRHLLAVYPRCFVGREAVAWLERAEGLNREHAVALGQLLVERGIVHHVLDEHGFRDGNFFYRFRTDEQDLAREMAAGEITTRRCSASTARAPGAAAPRPPGGARSRSRRASG